MSSSKVRRQKLDSEAQLFPENWGARISLWMSRGFLFVKETRKCGPEKIPSVNRSPRLVCGPAGSWGGDPGPTFGLTMHSIPERTGGLSHFPLCRRGARTERWPQGQIKLSGPRSSCSSELGWTSKRLFGGYHCLWMKCWKLIWPPEQIGRGSCGGLCLNSAESPKWKLAKLHYLSEVFIPYDLLMNINGKIKLKSCERLKLPCTNERHLFIPVW